MELCSEHHEEVCYEGRECPVCALDKEYDEAIEENEKLKEEITKLEDKIENLEDDIQTLKDRLNQVEQG